MKRWSLLISPVIPDAEGNGLDRRAWMWAHEMSQGGDLATLVIGNESPGPVARELPGRMTVVSKRLPVPRSKKTIGWRVPDPEAVRAALAPWGDGPPPDRILLFRLGISTVLDGLPLAWRGRVELDMDDLESEKYKSLAVLSARRGSFWPALQFLAGARFYARHEKWALEKFSTIHISASEDAEILRKRVPKANVCVMPNRIVGPPAPYQEWVPDRRPKILFVGTLGYLPNRDAVVWLMDRIQPKMAKAIPGVVMTVVGAAPERLGARLAASALDWRGYVETLDDLYEEAAVVIAPVRGGSGTKMKVLEAWRHRRAVVATRHAVRGFGGVPGRHVLIADTADEIVEACRRLIDDEALRRRIADEGHALFMSRFAL